MKTKVPYEEFEKVTYLDIQPEDARAVPLFPCYQNDEWKSWFPSKHGLQEMKIVDHVEGAFFFGSEEPPESSDVHMRLANLIVTRFYFPGIVEHFYALLDDLFNLGASIAKLDLFWEHHENDDRISRRSVASELEFMLQSCRSIFELLQAHIRNLTKNVQWKGRTPQRLPTNFARIALHDGDPRSTEAMTDKWDIPTPFANFYSNHAEFFAWLRTARNEVIHDGHDLSTIFFTDHGFAVSTTDKPFADLDIWNEENLKQPNQLGSVRALIGYMLLGTFHAFEDFANLVGAVIELPPDIAPDHLVWIRGEHTDRLNRVERYLAEDAWYN